MKRAGFRGRRRWLVDRPLCLYDGFARNPRLALSLLPSLGFSRPSWRRFSLKIHGKDFLGEIYEAAREVGMRPFLMWGTLLGFLRDGAFLGHDQDIDLGIFAADFARRDALIAAMARRGHRLRRLQRHKLSFWRRDGILYVDIDVFFPWNGKMICATVDKEAWGHWFPIGSFGRLREATFDGDLAVLIPEFPETILDTIYGDWRNPMADYNSRHGPLNRLTFRDDIPPLPGMEPT